MSMKITPSPGLTTSELENRTYAGVLGKIIGVYLGRAVEGWDYQAIQDKFGDINYYVNEAVNHPLIVPDDDISGTFLFYRALEDHAFPKDISAKQIGDTWLNYIVEDKTVLWWGGLGRSTEHTAYLRLKAGLAPPLSGSSELNGTGMSEQIGAEIFIDSWAMVNAGDLERTAYMARQAASVSHDGIAVEAACLLAVMQSAAYEISDIDKLLDIGLSYSRHSQLQQLVDDVRSVCARFPSDWRAVRSWLEDHHPYSAYPGTCPMVPNHALLLSAFILGGDDFQKGLMIAVSGGWDTDCNAGNLGALNGIRLGLAGLSEGADLRSPLAERMYVVSADGGECITDAVQETRKILQAYRALNNLTPRPAGARYQFEFPGSVQGFQPCPYHQGVQAVTHLSNANEVTQGVDGLRIEYRALAKGVAGSVSVPTFIDPIPNQRDGKAYFEVVASPTLYSTQRIQMVIETGQSENPKLTPFIIFYDETEKLRKIAAQDYELSTGENNLSWTVPITGGRPIHRFGIALASERRLTGELTIKSIDWKGAPQNLSFGLARELTPSLTPWHTETFWSRSFVSSARHFATDIYHTFALSHPTDNGVVSTGTRDWENYEVSSTLIMQLCRSVGLIARLQGHRRYYGGIIRGDTALIIKRYDHQETVLASKQISFEREQPLHFSLSVVGNEIILRLNKQAALTAQDPAFVSGGAGFLIEQGCVPARGFSVQRIDC